MQKNCMLLPTVYGHTLTWIMINLQHFSYSDKSKGLLRWGQWEQPTPIDKNILTLTYLEFLEHDDMFYYFFLNSLQTMHPLIACFRSC